MYVHGIGRVEHIICEIPAALNYQVTQAIASSGVDDHILIRAVDVLHKNGTIARIRCVVGGQVEIASELKSEWEYVHSPRQQCQES